MKAGLMAIGALFAGLGYALVFSSTNIPSLVYGANQVGTSTVISIDSAFAIAFTLFWAGVVLLPVGLAILGYGIAGRESSPSATSTQTSA